MSHNHMTEEQAASFRRSGYDVQAHHSTKKKKVTSWKLVYNVGKRTIETIITGKYPLCQHKKNDLKHDPNYRTGVLKIVPNASK